MTTQLLFLNLGAGEIIIIALVVLLLFGGKKIPELMNGLGKGVKSFRDGMKSSEDELRKALDEPESPKEKKAGGEAK